MKPKSLPPVKKHKASFVSSSLPSEKEEVKNHLYQNLDKPGPRGAYEARKVDGGFYIRVDMPGVPPRGITLLSCRQTRTVTFVGKAPKRWSCDSSDRLYGGTVVVDRDPLGIDVETTVGNGCLRLFFPGADGELQVPNSRLANTPTDTDSFKGYSRAKEIFNNGETLVFPTEEDSHINPFLLEGVEGVYEYGNELSGRNRKYLRVDMPGIEDDDYKFAVFGNRLLHGGAGRKEHRFDEGGREYRGGMVCMCDCCKVSEDGIDLEMQDGVFRRTKTQNRDHNNHPGSSGCAMGLFHFRSKTVS